jgi:hypothetical protein
LATTAATSIIGDDNDAPRKRSPSPRHLPSPRRSPSPPSVQMCAFRTYEENDYLFKVDQHIPWYPEDILEHGHVGMFFVCQMDPYVSDTADEGSQYTEDCDPHTEVDEEDEDTGYRDHSDEDEED